MIPHLNICNLANFKDHFKVVLSLNYFCCIALETQSQTLVTVVHLRTTA